jgi:uncharacterized protein YhbP (UPF0306 family)
MPEPHREQVYTLMAQPYEELFQVAAMTLSTVDPETGPWAATVYFVARQQAEAGSLWRLYFFSEAASQHAQNLARDGRAAAAIYPEIPAWQDIRGLQLRGRAYPVPRGDEWELAWQAYCVKFPFAAQLEPTVARNELYALTPGWIRLVDNRRGFGFKQEWTFP